MRTCTNQYVVSVRPMVSKMTPMMTLATSPRTQVKSMGKHQAAMAAAMTKAEEWDVSRRLID